jgi:hypothetical protein
MFSFGWNDLVLYSLSVLGIVLVLLLRLRLKLPIKQKRTFIYIAFIGTAILAALFSVMIKSESIGAVITRSIVFEAVSIYFLSERFFKS